MCGETRPVVIHRSWGAACQSRALGEAVTRCLNLGPYIAFGVPRHCNAHMGAPASHVARTRGLGARREHAVDASETLSARPVKALCLRDGQRHGSTQAIRY